jgi:hypothetical protein
MYGHDLNGFSVWMKIKILSKSKHQKSIHLSILRISISKGGSTFEKKQKLTQNSGMA